MRIRTYAGLLVLMLVGLVAGTEYATNWIDIKPADSGAVAPAEGRMFWNTSSQQVNVYDANLQPVGLDGRLACDYLVYTNGTHYFAKNCSTGVVEKSGTDFANIFNSLSGKVLLGRGQFVATELTLKSDMSLIGSGINRTIIKLQDWSNSTLLSALDVKNIIIKDITFDGNNENNIKSEGFQPTIWIRGEGVVLENIRVEDSVTWGLAIKRSRNVTVRNYEVHSFGNYRDGIDIVDSSNVLVDGVTGFSGDDLIAIKADAGGNTSDIIVRNVRGGSDIANCVRISSGEDAQSMRIVRNIIVENAYFENCGLNGLGYGRGIYLGAGSDFPSIFENIIIKDVVINRTYFSGIQAVVYNTSYSGKPTVKNLILDNVIVENAGRHGILFFYGNFENVLLRDVIVRNVSDGYEGLRVGPTVGRFTNLLVGGALIDYMPQGKANVQHGIELNNVNVLNIHDIIINGSLYGVVLNNVNNTNMNGLYINTSGWALAFDAASSVGHISNVITPNTNKFLNYGSEIFFDTTYTKNSGTTIVNSSDSVLIPHGLAGVPDVVTFSVNTSAVQPCWIAGKDSSNINITCSSVGTYDIYWYAEYKP